MMEPNLRENRRSDFFDADKIHSDLEELQIDYVFSGKRPRGKKSDYIELYVVTWIVDSAENFFIRYSIYMGDAHLWKEKIPGQFQQLMLDIGVSPGILRGKLRYFEVEKEKYLPREKFEKAFIEIRSKMKIAGNSTR